MEKPQGPPPAQEIPDPVTEVGTPLLPSKVVENLSRELWMKRHVATIHVANNLSLTQHKLWSAMAYVAARELVRDPALERHSIKLSVLSAMSGVNTNDWQFMIDAIDAMQRQTIQIIESKPDGSKASRESMTWMSWSRYNPAAGLMEFEFPGQMRRMLRYPDVYGHINIASISQFKSAKSLALYLVCARYKNLGKTHPIPIDTLRQYLQCEDDYYSLPSRLIDKAVKPAVAEVNKVAEELSITFEAQKRDGGRRISHVQFVIDQQQQPSLKLSSDLEASLNQALLARLTGDFGFTREQAVKVLVQNDEMYVEQNLDAVLAYLSSGRPTRSLRGLVLDALSKDYRPRANANPVTAAMTSTQRQAREEELARAKQDEDSARRDRTMIDEYLATLDDAAREELELEFADAPESVQFRKRQSAGGTRSRVVDAAFRGFVLKKLKAAL